MAIKRKTAVRKRLDALDRHKTMLDKLQKFVKAHPTLVKEYSVYPLHGKMGLKFGEYALVVPYAPVDGDVVLRLVKSGEDWINGVNNYYDMEKTVAENISDMPGDKLEALLQKIYREANPDSQEYEEEEDD
jgi:hypothetical protein